MLSFSTRVVLNNNAKRDDKCSDFFKIEISFLFFFSPFQFRVFSQGFFESLNIILFFLLLLQKKRACGMYTSLYSLYSVTNTQK